MYHLIKQLIRVILARRILFICEPVFRFVLYQFYRGKNYECNICNKKLRKFIQSENEDKLCPYCGSLPRARRLWEILSSEFFKKDLVILDFSPSRSLYRALKKNAFINYISTDISGDFLSDFQYDITNIDSEDDMFDVIICYHVLEHIENDYRAMKELYRILKKGGTCIVQTPFKKGTIYEDTSIKSESDRREHFGQKDHVRIYSATGLKERLIECGFHVTIRQISEQEDNRFGFKTKEEILFCTK